MAGPCLVVTAGLKPSTGGPVATHIDMHPRQHMCCQWAAPSVLPAMAADFDWLFASCSPAAGVCWLHAVLMSSAGPLPDFPEYYCTSDGKLVTGHEYQQQQQRQQQRPSVVPKHERQESTLGEQQGQPVSSAGQQAGAPPAQQQKQKQQQPSQQLKRPLPAQAPKQPAAAAATAAPTADKARGGPAGAGELQGGPTGQGCVDYAESCC
jgi:hypothetical protein